MNLKQFRNYLLGKGYAISTIGQKIRYLKRVPIDLDTLEDKYKIAEWLHNQKVGEESKNNFAKAINSYLEFCGIDYRLKLKRKKGDLDIWIPTGEQVERLLNATWKGPYFTARNRLILKILFIAGLRRDEVRKLRFSDFRRTNSKKLEGVYYFYLHVLGKGNKTRFVDIPESLYQEVIYFKKHYQISDFLFDNGKGEPISLNHAGRICKDAARYANVPQFHPHAARHYRTVELDEVGVGIETIRKFLGHAQLSTTQLYLRARRQETREELIRKDPHFEGLRNKIKEQEGRL